MSSCASCGRDLSSLPSDLAFCPYCGTSIKRITQCPNCGRDLTNIPSDIKTCPYCGKPLIEKANSRPTRYQNRKMETSRARSHPLHNRHTQSISGSSSITSHVRYRRHSHRPRPKRSIRKTREKSIRLEKRQTLMPAILKSSH